VGVILISVIHFVHDVTDKKDPNAQHTATGSTFRPGLYTGQCTSHSRYPVQGDIDLCQPNPPDSDKTTAKTPNVPPSKAISRGCQGESHLITFIALKNVSSRQSDGNLGISDRNATQNNKVPSPFRMDLVKEIKGMYHLLELVSESGSNGCGNILIQVINDPGALTTD